MKKASHSIIVINHRYETVQRISEIAKEIGQQVAIANTKDEFINIYSPDTRCIALELSMLDPCGFNVIRYLGERNSRTALILTSGTSSDLLDMACGLAAGLGLRVADTFLKPLDPQRLRRALIAATDPSGPA